MLEPSLVQDTTIYGSPERGFVTPVCARVHIGLDVVAYDEQGLPLPADTANYRARLVHGSFGPIGGEALRTICSQRGIEKDDLKFPDDVDVPEIRDVPITHTSEVYVEMKLRNLGTQMRGIVTSHFCETCPVQDICDSPLNPQR